MNLKEKRVAVFVAPGFEDPELIEPVKALKDAGVKVTIIGLHEDDKKGVRGKRGASVRADATIDEVKDSDFDMLVIPGGKAPSHLRRDERILDFVRDFDTEQKPIAAICHGPQVLASAGILTGRDVTSFFTVAREVKKAGANFINSPVVKDRNLVTSRRPGDIPAFTRAIFEYLEEGTGSKKKIA